MIKRHVQTLMGWFTQTVNEPRGQLDRTEKMVRFGYDLCVHGARALRRDKAPQMAAALSYRTLFALLPVVVVSTLLVRAVRGTDGFRDLVQQILLAVGAYEINFGADTDGNVQTLGEWLDGIISQAAGLNLAAIGWIGLAIVAYSAIGLLVTIENSFNAIYGAPSGRSWTRRIPTYWLLLTLSPVMIGITLYLDSRFARIINNMNGWSWLLSFAKVAWSFIVVWLLMFVIYRLVPNTKVVTRAAMSGGFVAAALLILGKGGISAYFTHAVSFQSLYGQLGLIPVFMFWMYIMWLVILFGLEVSATIQTLQGRTLEELESKRPQTGLVDPTALVSVMEIATQRFIQGQSVTIRELADETGTPETLVAKIIDRLVQHGFVHRVDGPEEAVALARVPDQISADRLIEIGYELVDDGRAGHLSGFVQRLREAQRSLAAQTTLASLLPAAAPSQSIDQGSRG